MSDLILNPESRSFTKEDELRLNKFVSHFGDLPLDYTSFLIQYNGGYLVKSYFDIDINHLGHIHDEMYGFSSCEKWSQLDVINERLMGRLPQKCVAIAGDDCGNLVCISLKKLHFGRVYFWDHEFEQDYLIKKKSMQEIASSFERFLAMLKHDTSKQVCMSEVETVISNDAVEQLKLMLDSGLDVNNVICDKSRQTLIEFSTMKKATNVINELIVRGASLGRSLEIANRNAKYFDGFQGIVKILEVASRQGQ